MYQYNKSRGRATLSPKEGPFFGPQFSLQASATTVNERPLNKQGGFLGPKESIPVKGQEVFSLASPIPKRSSSLATRSFGSEPAFSQSSEGVIEHVPEFTVSANKVTNMSGSGGRGLNPRSLVSPNLIPTRRHSGSIRTWLDKRRAVPTTYRVPGHNISPDNLTINGSVLSHIRPPSPNFYMHPSYMSGDRVVFGESPTSPGVPVVYRTPEERSTNPDRLNLDRRRLTVCPIIEGEEQLRLLNYQHNMISRIEHLSSLRRLIFLDLYDNQIEEISGLSSLKSLRVLMLGKNRIKKIEQLDTLVKLDVLDLHGNEITQIDNLNHLTELRVLNLAGNQIEHVDNLAGLSAVKEINLRRNRISTISDVDSLPNLEKLFLSFNEIASFEDISCIQDCPTLTEISLDGNPLCHESGYKQTILNNMQQLRQLDMKKVGDDERRIATVMARKDEEKRRETDKLVMLKERRKLAINNARKQWEMMQGSLMMRTSRLIQQPMPDLVANHVANISNKDYMDDVSESSRSSGLGTSRPMSAKTASLLSSITGSSAASRPTSAKSLQSEKDQWLNQNGRPSSTGNTARPADKAAPLQFSESSTRNVDYYTELEGDTLSLYGMGSLESLDKNWGMAAAGAVTIISFKFIEFDEIVKHLHKIRARFPSVHTLSFNSTNICSLSQFSALSSLRRLDNITIESDGNPVTQYLLWKNYLLFRLAHFSLKKINDVDVSTTDIVNAEKFFGSLAHITTSQLPQTRLVSLLGESKRKQLLTLTEDKRKSPDGKPGAERSSTTESVGRVGLVYTSPDTLQQRAREQKSRRSFVHSYMIEMTKEAVMVDQKRNALQKVWRQVFNEMVYTAVTEMWDTQAYMKSCMEEVLQEKT